jgi:cysteine-rich repeat protein
VVKPTVAKGTALAQLLGGVAFALAGCNAILGNDEAKLAGNAGASGDGGSSGSADQGSGAAAGESSCGDEITQSGEECDDGNDSNTDTCTNACTAARCGDGFMQGAEKCDDGNTQAGDGCSADCKREAIAIVAGGSHSCALLGDGNVKCWGSNSDSELGLGDRLPRGNAPDQMGDQLPIVDLGSGLRAETIAAGDDYNCAIFANQATKCWGYNAEGELGLGDTDSRGDQASDMGDHLPAVDFGTGRSALSIAAGALSFQSCALLDNHGVKCWGENFGKLGLGDSDNRGDDANEMADYLPLVDLGTGHTATFVGMGTGHACAVLDTGAVKCWGYNGSGVLGLGDGLSRGDQPNQMGDYLPSVSLGTRRTAKSIAAGDAHTCAVLDNGAVKCWGSNTAGQLGLGDALGRGAKPDQMGDLLPTVNLGTGRTARAVVAGALHTCVLLDDGSVKCWGGNSSGQLGLGDVINRGDLPGQMGDSLPSVDFGTGRSAKQIASGLDHTCALLDDGTVKCWGANNNGELGLGDTNARGDQRSELGDALPAVLLDE